MKYILISLFLACSLSADPLKLSNKQADELLGALLRVPTGLSAANTTKAARAINALRPNVEAYTKGIEASTALHIKPDTKVDSPAAKAYDTEVKKLQAEVFTYEIQTFILSDDELDRSKPSPAVLATLFLYLEPQATKK